MSIENLIAKKILNYSKRIEECLKLINYVELENTRLRRIHASMDERHEIICELRELNTKLIAYNEMKVELNSIIQELA